MVIMIGEVVVVVAVGEFIVVGGSGRDSRHTRIRRSKVSVKVSHEVD